jgi:anti-sigma B factor antagonist
VGILRLAVDEQDRFSCVALVGELDAGEVNGFERKLVRLEQAQPPLLVIDLRDVRFIDSHGLSALLDAEARARGDGRRLMLTRPPDSVMRVFQITLLDQRFEWLGRDAGDALEFGLSNALDRLRQRAAEADA